MKITFLGHQGWQFENSKGRSFLLDPILESIGNSDTQLPVWPARRLDFSKMAPIDAVIISHEHADHFSLETLLALPKKCRIYLSDLSSAAMAMIITEMGFTVERFSALKTFSINGLKITPLPGLYNTLEPDTYALLVEDDSRASFLTAIDTVAHPDIFGWLDRNCPVRTLDNLTNNFVEPRHELINDERSYLKSRTTVAGTTIEFVQKFRPRRAVISGQGWSFQGSKAQFNHSFFSVDNGWVANAARELAPHVEWIEGRPGMRFTLHGADLTADESNVTIPAPSVDRNFIPALARESDPYAPWTEVRDLPAERLRDVQRFVREEYGRILGAYAPKIIEGLYYLKLQDGRGLSPTFGVVVKNAGMRSLFELDYGQLSFHEVAPDAAKPPAVGFEIWAADFEYLIAAREEVFLIYESAIRPWTSVPGVIALSQIIESFMWFTPRFRPKETLEFYRSRVAALRAAVA